MDPDFSAHWALAPSSQLLIFIAMILAAHQYLNANLFLTYYSHP